MYTAENPVPASVFVGAAVAGYVVALFAEAVETLTDAFSGSEEPPRPVPRHVRQARCEPQRTATAER